MLTSKQRAYLKSLASQIDTILIIGKSGVGAETLTQAREAINARELIKCKVLDTSESDAVQVAQQVSSLVKAEVVQVIGSKFVLYKRNEKNPKIILPKRVKKLV